jgi:hypothetical protein
MNNIQRWLLFLIGCIGTRSLLTFLSYIYRKHPWFRYASIPAMVIGVNFIIIYTMGWRKTGLETGGERIWWNSLRPVHGVLWILFAVNVWLQNPYSYIILLVDTVMGLIATLWFRLLLDH